LPEPLIREKTHVKEVIKRREKNLYFSGIASFELEINHVKEKEDDGIGE